MKINFDVRCVQVSENRGQVMTHLAMREPRQLSGGGLVDEVLIVLVGDRMKVGSLVQVTLDFNETE